MADKIKVNHLTAWFGAVRGVHDVNMNIQDNNITAIIGPSGCGKSTLVRCLNRMHEVIVGARAEGEVLLDMRTSTRRMWIRCRSGDALGWCFRSPLRFRRCRLKTTSRRV